MRSVTKKPGFLPPTPLPPNEPYNFLCEMAPYIEICCDYSGGAGVPAQKFGLFVTAGCRTAASLAHRLLDHHTQQAFADTPKKKEEQ